MSNPTHTVLKPFEAGGEKLEANQRVDASQWRNTDNLVKHRYLKPVPVIVPSAVVAPQKEAPRQQSGNQQRR